MWKSEKRRRLWSRSGFGVSFGLRISDFQGGRRLFATVSGYSRGRAGLVLGVGFSVARASIAGKRPNSSG